MSRFTTVLFARPSFMSGIARTMDVGGYFDGYVVSATPSEADTRALAADFMAVAEDFAEAVRVVGAR